MIFNKRPNPPQPKHKCKLKIKRGKDGSMTKSIEGNCSKEEIAALNGAEE